MSWRRQARALLELIGRRPRSSRPCLLAASCGITERFVCAIALTVDDGDVGMMGELVEESGDGGGIGEDGVPVSESEVRRDYVESLVKPEYGSERSGTSSSSVG